MTKHKLTYSYKLLVFFLTLCSLGLALSHVIKEKEYEEIEKEETKLEWDVKTSESNDQLLTHLKKKHNYSAVEHLCERVNQYFKRANTHVKTRLFTLYCQRLHYN